METQEAEMIIKKKRSKRLRLVASSSLSLTMATSTSCSTGAEVSDVNSIRVVRPASSSSSGGLAQQQDDHHHQEEDMAKCLILLAQSHTSQKSPSRIAFQDTYKTPPIDAYQCKTCNRCFSSFQALGGHRASHKKPKPNMEKQENSQCNEETTITLSLQILPNRAISSSCHTSNSKTRVHECSICGAEFSSGQALGGHMRRHRPIPMVANNQEEAEHDGKKPKTLLSLDLNLPAPEDDNHQLEPNFPFTPKEQVIVFSASPLVDCHY